MAPTLKPLVIDILPLSRSHCLPRPPRTAGMVEPPMFLILPLVPALNLDKRHAHCLMRPHGSPLTSATPRVVIYLSPPHPCRHLGPPSQSPPTDGSRRVHSQPPVMVSSCRCLSQPAHEFIVRQAPNWSHRTLSPMRESKQILVLHLKFTPPGCRCLHTQPINGELNLTAPPIGCSPYSAESLFEGKALIV
jgi:hypothetical protein